MKAKILLFSALFFFVVNCFGQIKFQESFNYSGPLFPGRTGFCMVEISSGCEESGVKSGYAIITADYNIIRTDLVGNILWHKQFNYPTSIYQSNNYNAMSDYVQLTSDCGFLLAGSVIDSNGQRNYNLIKTDSDGNIQWTKQYLPQSGDSLYNHFYSYTEPVQYGKIGVKARQTNDGGYIVLGQIISKPSNVSYFHLFKTDIAGNVQWTKYYGGSYANFSHVYDLDFGANGSSKGFILLGQAGDSTGYNNYIVLIRIDSGGSILWTKKFLTPFPHVVNAGFSIKTTADNGFIVTGNSGEWSALTFKTDSSGSIKWLCNFGINGCPYEYIFGNSVKQTYDGGYIIGCSHPGSCSYEPMLLKIDSLGIVQWLMAYQRPNIEGEALNVIQTSDSGFAFCGSTDFDVFFVKTDKNGYSGCFDSVVPVIADTIKKIVNYPLNGILDVSVTLPIISVKESIPGLSVTNYCLTTSVEKSLDWKTVSLYPNPAQNELTIKNTEFRTKEVYIYDLLGQKTSPPCLLQRREESASINVSMLAPGICFVRVVDEKESWAGKFIKY